MCTQICFSEVPIIWDGFPASLMSTIILHSEAILEAPGCELAPDKTSQQSVRSQYFTGKKLVECPTICMWLCPSHAPQKVPEEIRKKV